MRGCRVCACALALLTAAAPASAQGIARSFEQLQLLVQAGDTVTVRDAQGAETSGRITRLTDSALTIARGGASHDFGEADVTTIRQKHGDPLRNGALWGLGLGAGFAGLAIAGICGAGVDGADGCGPIMLVAIPVYGAMGAGIGAGVDALISGQRLIFERPGRARVTASPMFGRGQRGVRLAVTF